MDNNKDYDMPKLGEKWLEEIRLAGAVAEEEKWIKRGKRIVRRYRDERSMNNDTAAKRYNILWSNVQTLMPSMYGKTPKAQVERRYKDQDPVGRTASQILERALQYELDNYSDYDAAMKAAVLDRLLPGRGTSWVRFESTDIMSIDGETVPQVRSVVDVVYWEDFRCSKSRTWEDVTWVARRVYMSKADGTARFGESFKDVPLVDEPIGLEESSKANSGDKKKAEVWEIWDKSNKHVVWIAKGHMKALDCKPDPYALDDFFPCPKPLYATQTTDTLVPVPDYALYQDQAEEIDALTQRISMLVHALKIVGVYDASQDGVSRMLTEGTENVLIPVDNWAALGEKGGIKGVVEWMPLDMVVSSLQQCYVSREQAKQVIYDVTGISDIIRGSSIASETATAQQIKSQFASLRLRDNQRAVAQYASTLLRIKAQMMSDLYPPQQLVDMSGIAGTMDAQRIPAAIQLLKTEPGRNFRIEVATDSLVEIDETAERESRVEFLKAAGMFLQQVLPVAQQAPQITPLLAEMLMFGVRSFRSGRQMEAAFETATADMEKQSQQPQPPQGDQPDQAMQVEQARMQIEQAKVQGEQAKLQAQMQIEQAKLQMQLQIETMKQQAETQRAELDARIRLELSKPDEPKKEEPND